MERANFLAAVTTTQMKQYAEEGKKERKVGVGNSSISDTLKN
jgi:hypothetical protein